MEPAGTATLETTTKPVQCTVDVNTKENKLTIKYTPTDGGAKKCIEIEITGTDTKKAGGGGTTVHYGHILTEAFDMNKVHPHIVSPTLIFIVSIVLLIVTFFSPVIVALLNRGVFGEGTKEYSPKTKFVYHPKDPDKTGFGGWTYYISTHVDTDSVNKDCKTGAGGESKDVHAYLWHFFDILMIIKISLE